MLRCRTVKALFDTIPIGPWRAYLIRRHIDSCPACQQKILSLEESRSLLSGPLGPDEWAGLRQRVRARIANEAARRTPIVQGRSARFLRWAPTAAMLLVLAATGVWLARESGKRSAIPEEPRAAQRFELDYLRIDGQPAGAYIYRPKGSGIIIVWAEKTP